MTTVHNHASIVMDIRVGHMGNNADPRVCFCQRVVCYWYDISMPPDNIVYIPNAFSDIGMDVVSQFIFGNGARCMFFCERHLMNVMFGMLPKYMQL
jgi:hypothetical protein